jgi:hypothetical protein
VPDARARDEARSLRNRRTADLGTIDRSRVPLPDAARPVIVRPVTITGETYPTTAGAIYPARLVELTDAVEKSNGPVTLTVDTESLVYVANVGGSIIPSNAVNLLAVPVNGVLVVRYG